MPMNILRILIIICLLLLISCGNGADMAKETDYETTKKMMVDILQTEDGKKALSEVLNDDAMKQRLVIDSDAIKDAFKEQFTSENSSSIWENYFKDPGFVDSFAKSMEKEHIEMLKRAMNDAEFQKKIMEIYQDPELISHFLTVLKSQSFREHLEKLIEQSLDTPSFQGKVKEMVEQSSDNGAAKESSDEKDQGESDDDTNKDSEDNKTENQ